MSRVVVNEGDTLVLIDADGVQFTLRDVFVCDSEIRKFNAAEEGEEEMQMPVLDVVLSSFDFKIDGTLDFETDENEEE